MTTTDIELVIHLIKTCHWPCFRVRIYNQPARPIFMSCNSHCTTKADNHDRSERNIVQLQLTALTNGS